VLRVSAPPAQAQRKVNLCNLRIGPREYQVCDRFRSSTRGIAGDPPQQVALGSRPRLGSRYPSKCSDQCLRLSGPQGEVWILQLKSDVDRQACSTEKN